MDYSMLSGAVTGAIGAYYQGKVSKIGAQAESNINLINQVTAGVVNKRNAQLTAMARWAQGVSNSRAYEKVAANQEMLAVNFNRARDARARQSFAENVAFAEEDGRQQAAAAASGVTGSVVDMINLTSKVRTGMERTAKMDAEEQALYDFDVIQQDSRQSILDNGLDWSLIFDTVQYAQTTSTPRQTQTPVAGAVSGLLGSLGTSGLQTLAGSVSNFFRTDNSIFGMLGGNRSVGD